MIIAENAVFLMKLYLNFRYLCDGSLSKQYEIICIPIKAMYGHSVLYYGKLEHWVSFSLIENNFRIFF